MSSKTYLFPSLLATSYKRSPDVGIADNFLKMSLIPS
uniref:Uncharacterized protein n=1 Tax=Lepeophtheirus salmonis TaxID=72036 RepID=A0A0K2U2I6_LEPSM